jgi:Ca-activated chloride channel family protein
VNAARLPAIKGFFSKFPAALLVLSLLTALALGLSGCKRQDATPAASASVQPAASSFTILAGSELKDIEPLLPALEQATGLRVVFKYAGTLEAVERLQSGESFDAAWLASNRYALLTPGVKEKILASERTMLTPVVLGLKQSKAKALGWLDASGQPRPGVTWKDIAQAAEKGQFSFGMTSPSASNTGFSGLIGLAAALADKGDALEEKDIDAKRLTAFFKAQTLTAGSSGWLAQAYVKEQARIDGMINYAASLHALNASGQLAEPLALIYPQEGILTADYPLMLLNNAKRADYDKLLAFVRSAAFQKPMTQQTFRKPVAAEVAFDAKLYPSTLIELPFPARLAVIDAVLQAFDDQIRRPADSSFVLDISGSMGGERLAQMKTALLGLTGVDNTLSGRFARLREREKISLLAFDDSVRPAQNFTLQAQQREQAEQAIRGYVNALQASGGTAVFSAAQSAYQAALARRKLDAGRFYSVVLLTDGVSNQGLSSDEFAAWYGALPEADKGLRIYAIQFGEARAEQLEALASLTGGRVFNATRTPLAQVFKEIRGYQ